MTASQPWRSRTLQFGASLLYHTHEVMKSSMGANYFFGRETRTRIPISFCVARSFVTTKKHRSLVTLIRAASTGWEISCLYVNNMFIISADMFRVHIINSQYKGLVNAKRPCDCSVLCLRPKSTVHCAVVRTLF